MVQRINCIRSLIVWKVRRSILLTWDGNSVVGSVVVSSQSLWPCDSSCWWWGLHWASWNKRWAIERERQRKRRTIRKAKKAEKANQVDVSRVKFERDIWRQWVERGLNGNMTVRALGGSSVHTYGKTSRCDYISISACLLLGLLLF